MTVGYMIKHSGIYCITHAASGRIYVGSAMNLDQRFKRHVRDLNANRHPNAKLQAAWGKYGAAAFTFTVLEACEKHELLAREQQWIVSLDAVVAGFNLAKFAGAPHKGMKHSAETLAKMRDSHKSRAPISEETRALLAEAALLREAEKKAGGFVVSEETRAKLAAAGKGRVFDEVVRAKIRAANSGKPLSKEHRQKLSEAHKGQKLSEERKEALRLSNLGKKRSDEFRQKMSKIAKSRSEETRRKLAESLRGRKLTEEHKAALRAGHARRRAKKGEGNV